MAAPGVRGWDLSTVRLDRDQWRQFLKELHQPSWAGVGHWLVLVVVFLSLTALAAWFTYLNNYLALAPLWLVLGHLMHSHLVAFHEAAHRTLAPVRWLNDFIGQLIGTLSFMSISLYRSAHHHHHAYLASEKDDELWPFTIPGTPRWLRCLAAGLELSLGLFYTPALFLRSYLRSESPVRERRLRLRVAAELAWIVIFWATALTIVALLGGWSYLISCYLIPALVAGNLQSLRKYIEHVGLAGNTATSATRTVLNQSLWGRLVAYSMFNVPLHGVHHRYGSLPQDKVPAALEMVYPRKAEEVNVYPSYWAAFRALLPHLLDPKVGGQWRLWEKRQPQAAGLPEVSS